MRPIATPLTAASTAIESEIRVLLSKWYETKRGIPESMRVEASNDFNTNLRALVEEMCEKWSRADDSDLEPEEELSDDGEDSEADGQPNVKRARSSVAVLPTPPQDGYPCHLWGSARPGHAGFTAHAREFLTSAAEWTPPSMGNVEVLPQQRNVAMLLHPKSPVERLLVDHNTGSGKTLLMVRVLDNYFFDDRPKLVIVPKDAVCDNFYKTLLVWPSRWRDFFASQYPEEASMAADHHDWRERRQDMWKLDQAENAKLSARYSGQAVSYQKFLKVELIVKVREALEMKRAFRNGKLLESFVQKTTSPIKDADAYLPAAPLRAYRFTSAGGRAAELQDGVPSSCIFKVRFDAKGGNVYSNKVVLMDEGHHLTRPHPFYSTQLNNLRALMNTARNTVFALCTGTMAEDSVKDPRSLLDAVKGQENVRLNDEGFLSSHHKRGRGYPVEKPQGVAGGALTDAIEEQLVHRVELGGEALVRYMFHEIRLRKDKVKNDKLDANLANYTNMYVPGSSFGNPRCKENILEATEEYAPKLDHIVETVARSALRHEKVLVMISRKNGFAALLALLQQRGNIDGFGVCDDSAREDFNSSKNSSGEQYCVLVANSETQSETVEFKCVRLHVLVDVPPMHSQYVQRASRSVRQNSHIALDAAKRSVQCAMFVATFPKYARTELGAFVLWALCGYWSTAKRKTYVVQSEPDAEDVVAAAQQILRCFERHCLESVDELRSDSETALEVAEEVDDKKLQTRLKLAIEALSEERDARKELPSDAHLTSDERMLARLKRQAHKLAPEVLKMRAAAVDAGWY